MTTNAQKLLNAAARDRAAKDAKTPEAAYTRAVAAGRVGTVVTGLVKKPSGAFRHPNLTLEHQSRIAFDTVLEIRAEFRTFERYLAYRRWDAGQPARGAAGVAA